MLSENMQLVKIWMEQEAAAAGDVLIREQAWRLSHVAAASPSSLLSMSVFKPDSTDSPLRSECVPASLSPRLAEIRLLAGNTLV